MVRLAIVHKEKCKPDACSHECVKVCPVNKKGDECVKIEDKSSIDEGICVGCAICEKRCPFNAIEIINLPSVKEENLIFRYGKNGFALYGLPVPKQNAVLGFLGRNGIGKSTAVEILSGRKKINLGRDATEGEIKDYFQGNELLRYFDNLKDKKIAYKPQNLSSLSADVKVIELLGKMGKEKEIKMLVKRLGIEHVLENRLNKLSGGELQKVAIVAATLKEADIYFFDEPLAFLDISERIRVSDFIREISKNKVMVVVEHDLLILDYLTDYINVFYGQQGAFGTVSGVKATKYGINSYLQGFLKEENMKIRDKELNFNFTRNKTIAGSKVAEWPDFEKDFSDEKNSVADNAKVKFHFTHSDVKIISLTRKDKLINKNENIIGEQGEQQMEPSDSEAQRKGFHLKVKGGEIKENHVIGILGKNGTGKTSFVKCLAGLEEVYVCHPHPEDKSSRGTIDGKMKKLDLKLKISYKPQYLFTEDDETVSDVMRKEKISKKTASMFNLEAIHLKKIKELSGGELQRFSIARCLAKEADVYLIDEPSAYLDVEERISCAKSIKEIMTEKQKTAFVVDHDLLLISYLADSVIVFSGESGKFGESSEILDFENGISMLLKELDITLRKDKESGRPRINSRGSVMDREQKENGRRAIF